TLQNLEWLSQTYELRRTFGVVQGEAAKVQPPAAVSHLVTEPSLGKPRPTPKQLPNIYRRLEKQYLGALKHWRSMLTDRARPVALFPLVEIGGKRSNRFSLEALIDKLQGLGYTTLSEPVLYHRPQAVVQRQLYQFEFSK